MSKLFNNYGILTEGLLHVSPKETFELCSKGVILVDVREEYMNSFKRFAVGNIIYLPKTRLEYDLSLLPANKYLIFADAAGIHSKEATQFLITKGFTKIANMAGGIVEWERDGLPLNNNPKEQLSGSCLCQLKKRNK
jgi:rhodanese-related sulfurtransferase